MRHSIWNSDEGEDSHQGTTKLKSKVAATASRNYESFDIAKEKQSNSESEDSNHGTWAKKVEAAAHVSLDIAPAKQLKGEDDKHGTTKLKIVAEANTTRDHQSFDRTSANKLKESEDGKQGTTKLNIVAATNTYRDHESFDTSSVNKLKEGEDSKHGTTKPKMLAVANTNRDHESLDKTSSNKLKEGEDSKHGTTGPKMVAAVNTIWEQESVDTTSVNKLKEGEDNKHGTSKPKMVVAADINHNYEASANKLKQEVSKHITTKPKMVAVTNTNRNHESFDTESANKAKEGEDSQHGTTNGTRKPQMVAVANTNREHDSFDTASANKLKEGEGITKPKMVAATNTNHDHGSFAKGSPMQLKEGEDSKQGTKEPKMVATVNTIRDHKSFNSTDELQLKSGTSTNASQNHERSANSANGKQFNSKHVEHSNQGTTKLNSKVELTATPKYELYNLENGKQLISGKTDQDGNLKTREVDNARLRPTTPVIVQPKKRALLCGVSYKNQRDKVKGAINDVKLMRDMLVETFKFPKESIRILSEEEQDSRRPTGKNIRESLQWLVEGCQSGDSLVFYYAGHGGRHPEYNKDEIDAIDEALIPVDSKQSGQIIDNEINSTIVRPLKKGVTLHAFVDACHSGTMLDLVHVYSKKQNNWLDNAPPGGGNKGTSGGLAICFSACEDHQLAADTGHSGAMTSSLTNAIKQNSNQTYGQLLDSMGETIQTSTESGWWNDFLRWLCCKPKIIQDPQLSSSERFDIYLKKFEL